MRLQIHIAGSKRSGKSTLARELEKNLGELELRPVLLEVDDVRRQIFGEADRKALIGSPENVQFHAWAQEAIFNTLIPAVLRAGGVPITVMTHSNRDLYYRAACIAPQYNARLKFLVLGTPSFEEVVRRAREDTASLSDTNNLEDPAQKKAYLESLHRFINSYSPDFQEPYFRVWQDSPRHMAEGALEYILAIGR